jgi:coenzyme F420-reducing hydrogenase delta subunit
VRAERRVRYVKGLLDEIGLGGDRLEMHFISSAMGREFAEVATEMTGRIGELGPSPLRERGSAT